MSKMKRLEGVDHLIHMNSTEYETVSDHPPDTTDTLPEGYDSWLEKGCDWLDTVEERKAARAELAALRARLEAASKSDEHNGAVIAELKRQLTEVVQERNVAHAAGFREGDSAGFKRGVEACKEKVRSLFPTHGDAARYDSPVKNGFALVIQVLDEDLLGKEPS